MPAFFSTSSASPVRSDSLTCTFPSSTVASAQIWSPARSTTISSFTSSSDKICFCMPSLNTVACGAFNRFILSRIFFARSSCTMPISVFPITIGRNVRFRYDFTHSSNIEIIKNIKLKYVNALEKIISLIDLSVVVSARLSSPCSTLSAASCSVRPLSSFTGSFVLSLILSPMSSPRYLSHIFIIIRRFLCWYQKIYEIY